MKADLIQDRERGLPASLDAERSILGGVLLENTCFYDCGEIGGLTFSLDSHRRIFARMEELISSRRAVDIVTLVEELAKHKELEAVGGVAYLASLTEGLPRRLSISEYVKIVREKRLLRQMMSICSDGVARAADQSEDADLLVSDIDRQLLEITHSSADEVSLESQTATAFAELEILREGKTEASISTGLPNLDGIIGGYKRKRLYVAGGRPSMGKTSLMIQAAIQHCWKGVRTRLVSLEMTAEELLHRLFAAISEVPFERLIEPDCLTANEWNDVERARSLVDEWPLEIDDRDGQTIDRALAGCRVSCRRQNTGFVALDYVQNLRFTGPGHLRHQEISDAAKKLRQFAKEENIPVLVLSSITEAQDKNPNRRPVLSDLRGSGDLAFHADVAILIHRERGDDGASISPETELLVAKQRGGRTGVSHAIYNTNTLMFDDI